MNCVKCKSEIPEGSAFCNVCGKKQITETKGKTTKSRGNGTGSVYKTESGKWQVAVTLGYRIDEDGMKRRKRKTKSGFKTKKEAMEYIHILKGEQETVKAVKFNALFDEWSKIHFPTISKSTTTAYKIAYKKCADMHFMNISDIKTKNIQAAIDKDKGGYYPKHDIKVLCNLMFKYALQNDYIMKNYAAFVKLPPVPVSKKDSFNKDEIAAIWKDYDSGNKFTGYILIMIYTGMRLGELQIIKKDDVDIESCFIVGGIKTAAGKDRDIPICDKILPIITPIHANSENKLLAMSEDRFYEEYYATLKRAGVRRLTPHCCRHTAATALVLAGVETNIIKEILGHSSFKVTADTYVHVPREEKLKAINRI